ncbi:MAG TPA: 7-cyano-7-deazaguanine synthase, partial [Candidatus Aminicenantes bacterium]|nr:7-cyano-7-deazaguanine synthase [Candidatus Aminicenantes bacterium]
MKIDCEFVERILTRFIREELTKFGYAKGILGLSGGLDSTVCAYLATKALGPGNVISLIMPYKDNFPQDVDDAREVARRLKLDCRVIDISPQVDAYFQK